MHALVTLEMILVSIDKLLSYRIPTKMSKWADDVGLHFGGYPGQPRPSLVPGVCSHLDPRAQFFKLEPGRRSGLTNIRLHGIVIPSICLMPMFMVHVPSNSWHF